MPTFVELPDKTELEFPDGMDEIAMHREIVKAFPQFGQETPSESAAVSAPGEAMAAGTPRAASLIPEAFPAQTEQLKEMQAAKTPELSGAEVESMLMTPQITIPNVIPKSFPITRGVFETVKGIPEFITAPGAPLITMAQQIPGVREAVDAAMGAGMVKTAALLAGEASVTGNKEQMAQAVSSGLLGSTMLAAPHVSPILANEVSARSVGAPNLVAADLAARQAVSIRDKPALVAPEAVKGLNKSVGEIEKMNVGEEAAPTLAPLENKPAPAALEQAPQVEAPAAETVSLAPQASEVAASESLPAISQTTPPSESGQVGIAATGKPEAAVAPLKLPQTPDEWLVEADRLKQERQESKGPGLVGMGGATPEEFTAPGTIVSNMFAAIDRDRAEMGKPPMEPGTPRTWSQDQAIAMNRLNHDPTWIPDLIKEVSDKPRPLLSWEQAGMVMQKAFWKAEANNALKRLARASEDGLQDDVARAKVDAARFEDNLQQMEDAVGRGGTGSEAGRTLQAQKMGLTDDLSLVEMRLQKRADVGGRRLTEAESKEVEARFNDIKAKNDALVKQAAESERMRAEAETRATLAEIGRQSAEAKVPAPHIQRLIEKVGQTIHDRANAARERLKGKLFTLSPEVLKDLAEVGADNIWTIGEDFTRWSVKMVEDIGERVKPHLQAIWDASKKLVEDTWTEKTGKKTPKVAKQVELAKQTVKKGDTPQQKIGKLTARIQDKFTKGKQNEITPSVQRLARAFVESGVRGREELIDAVHGVLEQILPDFWTRRMTMDAISGYGDYKVLSKDEVSLALRDLKGQMQQVAKLEDMASKQAPLRTGLERREPTPAETKLIKLVNEAKRKGGYETTDPAKQLRTALDEMKKKTQTMIDEYERRIREEDYSVRRLEPVKPDAALLTKQAELKRARKRWEEARRADQLANRAGWQKALDRFVRWERAFKLSSPVVFGKLSAAAVTRFVETAASETVGAGLGLLPGIREVARQAPREGGINVKAMAKGLTEAMTKGMRDAWETAKTGASNLDVVYGEKLIDRDWANVFGQLHGMLKAPVKRAEFTLSLEKRIEHALKNGIDVNDPLVMTRLATEALSDGYRSIFMQRGFFSDWFNTAVRVAEASKKHPVTGEITARTLRFLLPVVRVPMNIVAETGTGIYGFPVASLRTMMNITKGTLGKLDPVVADSIMRQFKKGSIGLGLMAIGYFTPQMVGGYDWREKRAIGAVKTGGFQVAGQDIPRWMTHAPWFELMQFGATIRHVQEQHVKGADKGIGEGLWAAGLGLIEETPFIGQMIRVDKLFESEPERTYYLGELAKGTLVPQAINKIAQISDRRFGQEVKRKPTTVLEHVESGIPGLRQNVPEAKAR